MPPGEIQVTCPGCSYVMRVPFAAVRRDNLHCPQCGKSVPLAGAVRSESDQDAVGAGKRKPRRPAYRPTKRR